MLTRIKTVTHLFKSLQQVAARHRQSDVYVVHYEERLFLALVWEAGKVVCDKQQHVDLRFLQQEQMKGNDVKTAAVSGQPTVNFHVQAGEFGDGYSQRCHQKA